MESLKQEIIAIEKSLAEQSNVYVPITAPVVEQKIDLKFPSIPVITTVAPALPKITGGLSEVVFTSNKVNKEKKIVDPVVDQEPEEPKLSKKEKEINLILELYSTTNREAPTKAQLRKLKAGERQDQIDSLNKFIDSSKTPETDNHKKMMDAVNSLSSVIETLPIEQVAEMDDITLAKYLSELQTIGINKASSTSINIELINTLSFMMIYAVDISGNLIETSFPKIKLAGWGSKLYDKHDDLVRIIKLVYIENKQIFDKYLTPIASLGMLLVMTAGRAIAERSIPIVTDPVSVPMGHDS